MKVNMFTKEEVHADQAKFCLLVLIPKYARDPWLRSLTSQTLRWMANEVHNENDTRMCGRGMRRAADQRVVVFFHTFLKDSSRRKLPPWRFETETVPSWLPCGHPHRYDFFFTKGYRSRIARLSLGWSMVDGRNGLFGWNLRPCQFYKEYIQTNQRTLKYILTPWHPVQRLKLKKGKTLFHKKPSRKRNGNQQKRQMYTQILSKNELVINAEEEEEWRKRKQTKNKWTW